MTTNHMQTHGAAFVIMAGLGLLLARYVGMENVWFFYPLMTGVVMMLKPWAKGAQQIRNTRIAGAWMAMGGVVAGLVIHTGMEWSSFAPFWMIGAGLTTIFWNRQEA